MNLGDSCPEEILKRILSYIDCRQSQCQASSVCRRWHRLLTSPSTHIDDAVDIIEVFQRRSLDMVPEDDSDFDESALGRHYRRIQLSDISALASYPNYVGSCNRLILHGVDFETILKSARIFRSLSSRMQNLEIRLFDNMPLRMEIIEEYFPNLESLTLRSGYTGHIRSNYPLNMNSSTDLRLRLIRPEAGFSLSPKRLDYVSNYAKSLWDLQYLSALPTFTELTYLSLGYILLDKSSFDQVLLIIRDELPKLESLKFERLSYSDFSDDFWTFRLPPRKPDRQKSALKIFEYSRFYMHPKVDKVVTAIYGVLVATFETVSINLITQQHPHVEGVYELFKILYRGNCELELRIEDEDGYCHLWEPLPVEFADILKKLDLAKTPSPPFTRRILGCGNYAKLTDLTFDQCAGLEDTLMVTVAQACPQLESLQISKCHKFSGRGYLEFLRYWDARKSILLKIRWEPEPGTWRKLMDKSNLDSDSAEDSIDEPRPMELLYLLIEASVDLLNGRKIQQKWKRNGDCRISIWEMAGANPKAIVIRDYVAGGVTKVERFSIP